MLSTGAPIERDVADEVLDYLHNHPSAADTLEGILNWWLPRQRYETARVKIQVALDRLVAQGLVEANLLADGTTIYSRSGSEPKLND